ncbi:MAG: Fur family transcriptional regulator [Thermoprotei archaeon]
MQMEEERIAEILRKHDLKATPQRIAVLKVLLNGGHYTGEQIYGEVKKKEPSISLSTVYNTLEVLERSGLVRSFEFMGVTWYEARLEPHVNVICVDDPERKIIDFDVNVEPIINALTSKGFNVKNVSLVAIAECGKLKESSVPGQQAH